MSEQQSMALLGFDASTRSTYFKWKKDPDGARLGRDKLERLLSGNVADLYVLREYLDSARGWS